VPPGLLTADGFDNLRRSSTQCAVRPRKRTQLTSADSAADGRLLYRMRLTTTSSGRTICRMLLVVRISSGNFLPRDHTSKWRELLITLRRLEDPGEIRVPIVSGFLGEQFALLWPLSLCAPCATERR